VSGDRLTANHDACSRERRGEGLAGKAGNEASWSGSVPILLF
jgi:hypothetical protein